MCACMGDILHTLCLFCVDCSCTWSAMYVPIASRYLKELSKLRLTDTRICKATKHRIFSVAVHPTTSQLLVAAGDKWGGVGLWNLVSVCRVIRHLLFVCAMIVVMYQFVKVSLETEVFCCCTFFTSSAMQCLCVLKCG